MTSDILPCPFCGEREINVFIAGRRSKIYCPWCGCTKNLSLRKNDKVSAADIKKILVSRWNVRVNPRGGRK